MEKSEIVQAIIRLLYRASTAELRSIYSYISHILK